MCVVSMRTPGPIVDDSVTLFKYLPLAADGVALTMLSTSACALATSESVAKEVLPTGAWMMPVLSTRNSTFPALISRMALPMSTLTVPVFGLGIRPRGPSTFPSLPTARIMSGVATTASKSMKPPWIFSTISSPPTMSAPASCASFCFSAPAIASTRLLLPRPCGSTTVPRTIWSACLGSTPSFSDSSTVSSNFAYFTFCTSGIASSIVYCRSAAICARAAANFLPRLRIDDYLTWFKRAVKLSHYPITSRPIDRAVPDTVLIAASSDWAFKSGIALPAAIWSFTTACIFFAMCGGYLFLLCGGAPPPPSVAARLTLAAVIPTTIRSVNDSVSVSVSDLLNLKKIKFHGRGAAEDRHHHLQRVLVEVHLVDHAVEAGERPFVDPHLLALLGHVLRLRLLG